MVERFGAPTWAALLSGLSAEDQRRVESVDPSAWYDAALVAQLRGALHQRFGGNDVLMVEMGRADADHELSTVHRWFLRLVRPSFALRNMNLFWRRSHDTGMWRSWQSGHEVYAELRDWAIVSRASCLTVLGFMGRLLELYGGRVGPLEHLQCRAEGSPGCVFRTHLDLPADEPQPGRLSTPEDISAVARELAQHTDREAFAEALVTLLRTRLDCSWVELLETDAQQQLRRVDGAGERGQGEPRCFVLEVAGRTVGRLDVELRRHNGMQGVEEVLHQLVPWIAIAMEMSRAAPAPLAKTEPGELARRLRRATETYHLTPRQTEVLELVVTGKTNKEIAATLHRTEGTVEVHVTSLLRKCGASNRAGLVAMFWGEL